MGGVERAHMKKMAEKTMAARALDERGQAVLSGEEGQEEGREQGDVEARDEEEQEGGGDGA
jgi:hypothetical protein